MAQGNGSGTGNGCLGQGQRAGEGCVSGLGAMAVWEKSGGSARDGCGGGVSGLGQPWSRRAGEPPRWAGGRYCSCAHTSRWPLRGKEPERPKSGCGKGEFGHLRGAKCHQVIWGGVEFPENEWEKMVCQNFWKLGEFSIIFVLTVLCHCATVLL